MVIRDSGWDSAWDDESEMTDRDRANRAEFLAQQRDIGRQERMMRRRAEREEEDHVTAAQNAEKYNDYWEAVEAAKAEKLRRETFWSNAQAAFWVVVVLLGLWGCTVATNNLP